MTSTHRCTMMDALEGPAAEFERRSVRLACVKVDSKRTTLTSLVEKSQGLGHAASNQPILLLSESSAPKLMKNRWRGPAATHSREDDPPAQVKASDALDRDGFSLLRVAPEHIRPRIQDDSTLQEASQSARSTTQRVDSGHTPVVSDDVDTDVDDTEEAPSAPRAAVDPQPEEAPRCRW